VTADIITLLLTGLAVLDVVLTRARMLQDEAAGRARVSHRLVTVHTVAGTVAIVLWVVMVLAGDRLWGVISLPFWWVATAAGLAILVRWLPPRGRRASGQVADSWSAGPGLSILAHVGMLAGVVLFTVLLAADKIP
jgi:hypothetical protein